MNDCLHFSAVPIFDTILLNLNSFLLGFEMDRNVEQLHERYERLPKDENGKIKTKKKEPYSRRTGQTQKCKFQKLDVTDVSSTIPLCNLANLTVSMYHFRSNLLYTYGYVL